MMILNNTLRIIIFSYNRIQKSSLSSSLLLLVTLKYYVQNCSYSFTWYDNQPRRRKNLNLKQLHPVQKLTVILTACQLIWDYFMPRG